MLSTRRTKPRRLALLALLLAVMATAAAGVTVALAQPTPESPPSPADEPGFDDDVEQPVDEATMRERLRERMRIMRAWRLTEVIDLDEATAIQLFDHLDAFDVRIHAEQDRLSELGRQMRRQLASDEPDEAELRGLIEQITQTHLRIEELRTQMVLESGEFLDARQQAGFMLFVPEFDRQIQQLMRDARRQRGPRGEGMRRGDGPRANEPPGHRGGRRRGTGRRGLPPGLDVGE